MILAPRAMMLMVCMPVVGRLYRHADARLLVVFGILVTCWSYYDLARLSLSVGFWDLVPTLLIMGIGLPFVFVTMTTLSLSTIPRADMTDASGLYTLARRIGGNLGYALAASLVARGEQVHRIQLVSQVTPYNFNWTAFQHQTDALLRQSGLNPAAIKQTGLALMQLLVSRQAAMMAYNDVAWIMGLMFLATLPMALLLPGRKKIAQQQKAMTAD